MTTGRPALAACRTKRRPDITVSDEPATSSGVGVVDRRVAALDPLLGHVLAEEHHVAASAARRTPSQRGYDEPGGLLELHVAVGPDRAPRVLAQPARVGLARAGAASPSRWVRPPQSRQTTSLIRPCSATICRCPARSCSPSTFWVIRKRPGRAPRAGPARGARRWARPRPSATSRGGRAPSSAAGCRAGDEVLEGHRHPHRRAGPAVVGDAGVGAQSGAGRATTGRERPPSRSAAGQARA